MTAPGVPDHATLFAELRPALLKYFTRKSGNPAEAEDLTHEVLARMLDRPAWESAEQAKGYIFRAAVNQWNDRQRRHYARSPTVDLDDESGVPGDEITPERVLMGEQELSHLMTALLELSERTRDIFILVRLEHMKQAQIAGLLGISVSAVEKHLARALAHLAKRAVTGRSSW